MEGKAPAAPARAHTSHPLPTNHSTSAAPCQPTPHAAALRCLNLAGNPIASLPPALSAATALVELDLSSTHMDSTVGELDALLGALPHTLRTLDLRDSWVCRGELDLLQWKAEGRGLTVLGTGYEGSFSSEGEEEEGEGEGEGDGGSYGGGDGYGGWGEPGYDSSTSDSSDGGGGGPRYSWGGCAYASCWYD